MHQEARGALDGAALDQSCQRFVIDVKPHGNHVQTPGLRPKPTSIITCLPAMAWSGVAPSSRSRLKRSLVTMEGAARHRSQ